MNGLIALAASLGWHFANEDADLSFVAQGYLGEPDIYKFLAYLAMLEPRSRKFDHRHPARFR